MRRRGGWGFTFEGIFRQHMMIAGKNRDTARSAMLDFGMARRKTAFERWLDPGKFDADGRQRTGLSALNAGSDTG